MPQGRGRKKEKERGGKRRKIQISIAWVLGPKGFKDGDLGEPQGKTIKYSAAFQVCFQGSRSPQVDWLTPGQGVIIQCSWS